MIETNYFQTIAILHPEEYEESHDKLVELCQTITSKYKQLKIGVNYLGTKSLAYEIRGIGSGHYVEITWIGTREDTRVIEHYCHENNNILKFITIKINVTDVDHPILEPLIDTSKEYADAYDIIFG